MPSFLDNLVNTIMRSPTTNGHAAPLAVDKKAAAPTKPRGLPGFAVYGGYLQSPETNWRIAGMQRWVLASDIVANISIVAASLRYMLNLIARPQWKAVPANDTAEAKALAEFMESVLYGMDTSWSRIVRRTGTYRYHGFGFHEWTAKRRDDGKIGIAGIDPRPQHTINRWDIDDYGDVRGVWQVAPQQGMEVYLPRQKLVYLVDDTFTDNPEGVGWFRHLVDPANRMTEYLRLEEVGFERDLSGIPIARAPIAELNKALDAGEIDKKQYDDALQNVINFVQIKNKAPDTGLVLDSTPYIVKTESGESVSSTAQWDIDLLTGEQTTMDKLAEAVRRTAFDMAAIIGTEQMLVGREGAGSLALSEDKSRNLYLNASSILMDMSEAFDRDIVGVVWAMNGLPDDLRPWLDHEDVSFQDAEAIARTLRDMAAAGAVLAPDDPAINDLRNLMGLEDAPELTPEERGMLMGTMTAPGQQSGKMPAGDPNEDDLPSEEDKVGKAEPRSLYVHRKLLNANELIAWAKAQGFAKTVQADEMHVTITFSRQRVDWIAMGDNWSDDGKGGVTVPVGGPRLVERLGDKGAVVLLFASSTLAWRHEDMVRLGASWDWPQYQPHVTITYDGDPDMDLSKIEPYRGALKFGPEVFEEVVEDWQDGITEKARIS